jgi:hypothetical protein
MYTKRGILTQYLLIFTILTVAMSIGLFYHLKDQQYSFSIGEVPRDVIQGYVDVGSSKFYLETKFDSAFNDSIKEVLNNSGINGPIIVDDYILWKKGSMECYPNEWNVIKENLILILKDEFGGYNFEISRNQGKTSLILDSDIAHYNEINGTKINYSEEFTKQGEIEFVFDDFILKVDDVKDVADLCGEDEVCWQNQFNNLGSDYDFIEMKDKLFKFELITQGLEGQIVVKGAVDLDPDYNFGQEELKC